MAAAFASTVDGEIQWGGRRITYGSFTGTGGSTGDDITTGLIHIEGFQIVPNSSGVIAKQITVNETFPLDVDGVTVVTNANDTGYWVAMGY